MLITHPMHPLPVRTIVNVAARRRWGGLGSALGYDGDARRGLLGRGIAAINVVGCMVAVGCSQGESANAPSTTKAATLSAKALLPSSPKPKDLIISSELAIRLNVGTAPVRLQSLARQLELVGSVEFDQDKVAIAGPRLAGRIIRLPVRPGDVVKAGAVLAEIDSVDLARASADYLGVKARADAANANADRERELAQHNASSQRQREAAEAEARVLSAQALAAERYLQVLGRSLDELPGGKHEQPLNLYRLRAPISGAVVERSVVLGQAVHADTTMFKIADLSHVWIKLEVYERDLSWMRPGLVADLRSESHGPLGQARVAYVSAQVADATRTAQVHLDFENKGGRLREGQFVTALLRSEGVEGAVMAVPREALQLIDGQHVLFVRRADGGFAVRPVKIGLQGSDQVELYSGVAEGDQVATTNAFLLKSEVLR